MRIRLIILALVHHTMVASTIVNAAPLVGHARRSTVDASNVKDALEELARGIPDFLAHVSQSVEGRRINSALDKLDVLVQNGDCHACMDAPPDWHGRRLRADEDDDDDERPPPRENDVLVNAENCNGNDPYQIWNLLSLEPSGTWFLFESAETRECMQLVGSCEDTNAKFYDIVMGPCDSSNEKAFWAFSAGIGEIVHFECMRSNVESHTLILPLPDIFLEANCIAARKMDHLDFSSHNNDFGNQAENTWMIFHLEDDPAAQR